MKIDIHPEAATRFDQMAEALVTKVVPEPPHGLAGKSFRPDIHPVFRIPEQDIVGEIQITKSIVNGAGDEVGRLFEHEGHNFGLIGDGFKALTMLATRVQRLGDLSNTTTVEFIRDLAIDWVERKYAKTCSETFSEHVLKTAGEAIKEFEIWIPFYRTYVESTPLPMGGVVLRTITREMMDQWHAKKPELAPESAAVVQLAFDRDRSAVQGCVAATIKICAERSKALDTAREQATEAAGLLRFLSLANWTPKLRSFCTPLGSEHVRQRAELFLQGNFILNYSRGALDHGAPWVLSNSDLVRFPGLLNRLDKLATPRNRSEFEQHLYDALLIYSRNSVAIEPADKLIYILVALESMLLRNENEPLGKNIGERLAFLTGNSLEARKAVVANVIETYRLRSSFLHHGHSVEDLETLSTFMLNAWTCFYNLVMSAERYRTKDELISALEDRKMS